MQDNPTLRFEANTRAAQLENILVGVIVAVVGPGLYYFSDVRNPLLLAALAIGGFIAGYGLYTLRNYFQAALSIEITDNNLIITKRRGPIQLPWTDIREVAQRSQHGTFFMIHVHSQRQPHIVRLEGYSPEQIAAIQAQIEQRRQAEAQ